MFWSKKDKKAKQGEKEERKKIEPLPPKVSEREFVNEKSEQAANAFIQSMIDQVGKLSLKWQFLIESVVEFCNNHFGWR